MRFEDVHERIKGVPYMTADQGKVLYDFILKEQPIDCLELGFAHGVSACYTAAALDELGRGHITAVDLEAGRSWQTPSIDDLFERTGLGSYVTVVRENSSYTWFLKKMFEKQSAENGSIDFCYIDGAKNWTIDGFAFLLVDKLLRQGGWILFDDYTWTYDSASEWAKHELESSGIPVSQMGEDELKTPHVELIFQLLVMKHPDYSEFKLQDDWAWAHKISDSDRRVLVIEELLPLRTQLTRGLRRVASKLGS